MGHLYMQLELLKEKFQKKPFANTEDLTVEIHIDLGIHNLISSMKMWKAACPIEISQLQV